MKRVSLAVALACPLAVLSLGGCYWLLSTDDLTSAPAEGGADSGVRPADAALDGDGGADAEGGRFCPDDAGPLVYCMDFDEVDAAAIGLGASQAFAALVNTSYVSPPNSLFVKSYATAAGAGYGVSFQLRPRTVKLQFELRAPIVSPGATTSNVQLIDDSTQTDRMLNVVADGDGAYHVQEYFSLEDGGSAQNDHPHHALDAGAALGEWHHVVLTLTADDSQQQYLSGLTVDGQVFEDAQPLVLNWAQGRVSLSVGVAWANGGGPQLYFDNVRADFGL